MSPPWAVDDAFFAELHSHVDDAFRRAVNRPTARRCSMCGAPEDAHPYRHPFRAAVDAVPVLPPQPPQVETDPGGPRAVDLLRQLANALERGGVDPVLDLNFVDRGTTFARLVDAVSSVCGLRLTPAGRRGSVGDHGLLVVEVATC